MKLSFRRGLSAVLAIATLVGAWLLYKGDFWTLRTEAQKLEAIRSCASADSPEEGGLRACLHPVLLHDKTLAGRRVLTFTDSEIDGLLGYVQFRRGVLGGWQPLGASYGGAVLRSFTLKDRDIRIVFAADCPPEIAHYRVQANLENDDTLMAEGDVTEPDFFHVHETDRQYFPNIHLYDAAGNELDSTSYLASDGSVPSPSIGSAEINLVYVFCGILLGLGWIVCKYFWDTGAPPKEKEEAA